MQKGFTLILIALVVAVGGYFLYQQQTKSTSVTQLSQESIEDSTTFVLGNFTVSLPNSEIAKSTGDFYGQVNQTKIEHQNPCSKIAGIHDLYLEKNNPKPKEGYSKALIQIDQWNYKDLQYASKEDEQQFRKYTDDLITNLPKYEDEAKLRTSVLASAYSKYPVDLRTNFGSCGGSFSIPILISKIDAPKFDLTYYAEVIEGNGDVNSYPSRALVIKKDDSWLIVKEGQGVSPDNWLCVVDNKSTVPPEDELKCAIDTWAKEHRNEEENQKWIQKMLDNIIYTQ